MTNTERDLVKQIHEKLINMVHGVCIENGIPYVLCGRTALSVQKTGSLDSSISVAEILIHLKDAPRLSEALNALGDGRYVCESWLTNDGYPTLNLRFMDTATTCIDLRLYGVLQVQGIQVLIHCLKPYYAKADVGKKRFSLQTLRYDVEQAWYINHVPSEEKFLNVGFSDKASLKRRLGQSFVSITSRAGKKENYLSGVARQWLSQDGASRLAIWEPYGIGKMVFDSELLDCLVATGDSGWFLPSDIDAYLTSFGGSDWRTRELADGSKDNYLWCSATIPYGEIAKTVPLEDLDLDDAWLSHASYMKFRDSFKDDAKQLTTLRRWIHILGAAHKVEVHYTSDVRREIIDAYVAKDSDRLFDLFDFYRQELIRVKRKYAGCILLDDVLEEIFLDLLVADGEVQLYNYVKKRKARVSQSNKSVAQVPLSRYETAALRESELRRSSHLSQDVEKSEVIYYGHASDDEE